MKKEENVEGAETQEVPEPGNPPAILEIVEYIRYYAYQKKSREEIRNLLSKEYTFQEINTAFAFYEKFMV